MELGENSSDYNRRIVGFCFAQKKYTSCFLMVPEMGWTSNVVFCAGKCLDRVYLFYSKEKEG